MTSLRRILAAVLITSGLSACGLKGDLYLEEPEAPAETSEAAPAEPEVADTDAQGAGSSEDEIPAADAPEADSAEIPAADDAP